MSALVTGVLVALVGLGVTELWAARLGGRRWRPGRRRAVSVAVAAVLALAWLTPRWSLRYGDALVPRLLAAVLVVLLGVYLWQLLPRLRPLLGRQLDSRPSLLFAWLPFVVYLSLMPWATQERPPDGDEPYYLLLTHSLAHDFDTDLANNYAAEDSIAIVGRALEPQQGDPTGPDGEIYSRHNALMPALLVPVYLVAGRFGVLSVMCAVAALLAWWSLRLARHWFADRPGAALAAYFVVAFTPPLLLYSHQVWVEIPAALLFTIGLDAAWSLEAGGRRGRRLTILLLVAGVLPLLKLRFLLLVAPLLLLAGLRLRGAETDRSGIGVRGRRIVAAALLGLVLLAAAMLWFNQITYGNPLKYHDLSKLDFYWKEPGRYPVGFAGLLFDVAFGLFACAPIWLLLFASRPGRRLALEGLLLASPYLLALVPRAEWYGAWSPPFRYGCFALALLMLLLVPIFERRRGAGARWLLGALGGSTAVLTLLWTVRPGWTYNFAHGRSHLVDLLSSTMQIDVARFFPTALRPNLALWCWPPVLILLVVLLWRTGSGRRRHATAWTLLGVVTPPLLLAGVLVAAHRVPTSRVEAEDPYVAPLGGTLYPEQWVTARARHRGGWRLGEHDRLVAPVVAGGSRFEVDVEFHSSAHKYPIVLWIAPVGSPAQPIEIERLPGWRTVRSSPAPWPADTTHLSISFDSVRDSAPTARLLVDRVRIRWLD